MTTPTAVGHVGMQIAKVVGLSAADDQWFPYVVLEEARRATSSPPSPSASRRHSAWRLASVGSHGFVR